jgi:large subunit ribosomal protein L31
MEVFQVKDKIHPNYETCMVKCSCGNTFETRSTQSEIKMGICSVCHPFYTGDRSGRAQQAGQVEKFRQRYAASGYGKDEK